MEEDFILNIQAESIIEEAIIASNSLPDNFNSLPIVDYVCSALFLKTTGLLEQKFKVLAWKMATHNREYRKDFLDKRNFGEFSNYESKQTLYKDLIKEILLLDNHDFIIKHKEHLANSQSIIKNLFNNTIFQSTLQHDYLLFNKKTISQSDHKISSETKTHSLLPNPETKDIFEFIVKKRNKIAHNAFVNKCVKNELCELSSDYKICENFFMQLFILIYMDNVFNQTYQIYKDLLENK